MSDQSTKSKIKKDLISFMKSGEKDKVEILRYASSFIKQEEKDKNIILSESQTIQIIKKVLKRNQESFDQFTKAGRTDLADKEKKEMDIIGIYLPEEMTEDAIIDAVKESIVNCQASSIKDMGKVMADVKKLHGDNANMSLVSKYVREYLNN
ncbi:MAG: GatB/YqeY domain-containing protein [Gammaproteobacteria bacterium]|nr:GatB/YqeY domain-containing protein [Gammaproteobacteria bacterium]MBT5644387.1 GatB/YqeY domain-containing protein [Gammaproteobacteria bacterium]MBT5862936.1 GatB/YqeY domain-containing protein [Gammaproteobacteria bacterium]MBT6734039.1 GatB/YqeY domain-containing protein [Gammaproteobacteria bacterium]MBT7236185.1 GatB/YqeY domain-containing protein [Gammaproteobacteria bacterium]|tara:strand:+ start:458 stop:913 length:456 start_codon:yes stop_codon:yes gene_type:complete